MRWLRKIEELGVKAVGKKKNEKEIALAIQESEGLETKGEPHARRNQDWPDKEERYGNQ